MGDNNSATGTFDLNLLSESVQELASGGTVRQHQGITDEEMDLLYSTGYNFYTTGNYADAEKVFQYLVYLDHVNQKYWQALGSALQARRDFARAATAYSFAGFLDLTNPQPQYYAAQCFLALGDDASALAALDGIAKYASADSPFQAKAAELKAKIDAAEREPA